MPRIEDIPPDAIEWPPNRLRQERSPWEVDDLKADIEANGQDVPIIVWRDPATGRIYGVAGETRWLAMKAAEEKTIRAEFTDEADPLKRRSIEFRENNSRNAMTWRDSARAIATQHNMRVNANPRWTQQNTAEEMGVGQSYVSRCCDLYKCADKSEVWEEKNFDAAYNKLKLHEEIDLANRVNANLEAERRAEAKMATTSAEPALFVTNENTPPTREMCTHSIIEGNFNEWAPTYDGQPFSVIHCDFPYGINIHKGGEWSQTKDQPYEDTPKIFFDLLDTLIEHHPRLVAHSAHMIFWFSLDTCFSDKDHENRKKLFNRLDKLRGLNWEFEELPLIWFKKDNKGIPPRSKHGPRRNYETALFGFRNGRQLLKPCLSNVISKPTQSDDESHQHIKPMSVLKYVFEWFVDPDTRLLDPTCGSGTAIRVAKQLGAAYALGIEINPEFAKAAQQALEQHDINEELLTMVPEAAQ